MILLLFSAMTDAIIVQRGVVATSGNSYFQQAQEAVGKETTWTRYHRELAGVDTSSPSPLSLEQRGVIALRCSRETARFLQSHLLPAHRNVIEQAVGIIQQALSQKEIF